MRRTAAIALISVGLAIAYLVAARYLMAAIGRSAG